MQEPVLALALALLCTWLQLTHADTPRFAFVFYRSRYVPCLPMTCQATEPEWPTAGLPRGVGVGATQSAAVFLSPGATLVMLGALAGAGDIPAKGPPPPSQRQWPRQPWPQRQG